MAEGGCAVFGLSWVRLGAESATATTQPTANSAARATLATATSAVIPTTLRPECPRLCCRCRCRSRRLINARLQRSWRGAVPDTHQLLPRSVATARVLAAGSASCSGCQTGGEMSLGAVQERRRWRGMTPAALRSAMRTGLRSEAVRVSWRAFWMSRLLVMASGVFALLSFQQAEWAPRFDPAKL